MTIQEPPIQPIRSSSRDENDPRRPQIPIPTQRVLHVRCNGACTVSIDEQGYVQMCLSEQETLVLGPEEAFDLFDFLFAYRNLLAAYSAEIAEQQVQRQVEN